MDENLTTFYHYDATTSQLIIGNRLAWVMASLLNNE